MDERFRKAEEEYYILRGKLDTGRIGKNLFELALRDSMVQDAQNRWWMLGPDTGNWYMHDGTRWVEADPSHVQVAAEVTSAAPKSSPGKSSVESSTGSNRAPLFLGIGCAAFVCVALVLAGAYFIFRQPLRPPDLSSNIALGTPLLPLTTPTFSQPLESVTPTLSPSETTTPTSTRFVPPRPSNTPTQAFPPGVYVTGLRIDPAQPKRKFDITFYPKFLNTTGVEQNHRMLVYVYYPERPDRPMGQTFTSNVTIPPGISERAAPGWVLSAPGGCEDFILHVASWDDLKNPTFFNLPTGALFSVPITVCPP